MKKNLLLVMIASLFMVFASAQGNNAKPKGDSVVQIQFTDSTAFISINDLNEIIAWSYKNLSAETHYKLINYINQYVIVRLDAIRLKKPQNKKQ